MENMVALRCKYCGAPLDESEIKGDSPYVTCSSCGTTQQKMDAQAYLEQLMGQVRSWVNQALPGGMAVAQSQNVDVVARHNIFMTSFKPRVDMEFTAYKFGLNNLLSQVMMIMPFSVNTAIKASHSSTQAFEFGAKMNEIAPLAMGEESSVVMTEVTKVTDAYAMLINNSALIREDKPGRYILMANNFTIASQDFGAVPGYAPAKTRFEGLALLCNGCEKLLNGDVASAYGLFNEGRSRLSESASATLGNLKVAIMGQAVNQEVKQADALIELAQYVNSMGGSREVFDAVRRIFTFQYPAHGNWAFLLNNHDRLAEVLTNMSECVKAKTGGGAIPVTSGAGDILVPFWHIDLKYSFQTGSLWKKHSVEVSEPLLIPADFVIDGNCLSNPRMAVTDVFNVKGSNGLFAGLTGSETSISNSLGLGDLIKSASPNSVGGREVIIPLSTRREAERLAESYVQNVARAEDKLKLSNPDVAGLVFIPFTRKGDSLVPPSEFGSIVPARIMATDLGQLIII
ncbi:MAG: hypothetical protein MJZ38_04490 [archaeon]|nr:hypothetical protein [archaeon]